MTKIKRIWIVLGAVAVLLLIGILVAQHFLDADTYRGQIEAALSDSLGRQVTLGHLSFSIFSGSLVAESPSIADDPAFSNQPFLTAKDIRIGVETGAFLFHRELHITGFTVEEPKITLLRRADGVWNYSSLGGEGKRKAPTAQSSNLIPNLTVNQMDIKGGTLTVGTLPAQGQPHVYSDLNVSAQNFSFANAFPFTVSCKLPGGGTLDINGQAGPISQTDASLTPLTAQVSLKHADLAAQLVGPSQGISGIADLDAKIVSNGQTANTNGKLHLTKLKLAKDGSPSPEPVDITFSIDQNLQSLSGKITKGNVLIGKAAMGITGTYETRGNTTTVQINADGQNMPINELVEFLPSLGVQLPPGSRLQGGTLTATLNISGPTTAPAIDGPVRISNAQLAGFDLGQKLASIQALTGAKTGSNTTIQVLSTNLHHGPDGTRTDNLQAVVAGLGDASGNGSISPEGALNYHLVVKLAGVGGVATTAMSLIPDAIGSTMGGSMKSGIPVTITGTTSHPVFTPDMGKMIGGSVQKGKQASNPLSKKLGGLLGH